MSTKKHPHEAAILAYYRGETVQSRAADDQGWLDVATYSPGIVPYPSFDPKRQYRVKPKTHTVELTEDEIDALILVLRSIGGSPTHSPRLHTGRALLKLTKLVGDDRFEELVEWGRVSPTPLSGNLMFRDCQLPR